MRYLAIVVLVLFQSGAMLAQATSERRLVATITHRMNCEDAMGMLDLLLSEVSSAGIDRYRAVAIYYEGNHWEGKYSQRGQLTTERIVKPVFGEVQNRVRWLQNYVNFRKFPKERITFHAGGYRQTLSVDLWIVPDDGPYPMAEPGVKTMKFRSGSMSSFSCL